MEEDGPMSFRTVEDVADVAAPDDTVFSLIDRHTTVDGTLTTSYDLRIDGQVLGILQCEGTLYVSEGASVDATIEAGNVVVAGSVSGAIRCRGRLEIQSSGTVKAEVATSALVILEGAVFEGQIRMESPPRPQRSDGDDASEAAGDDAEPYSFLRRFRSDDDEITDAEMPAAPEDEEPT
jgi:cytoskeletal protein CcmA (bactofilin family)